MARVFEGDRQIFKAMTYCQPAEDYLDYVQDRYEDVAERLTGSARDFMSRARDKYAEVRNSDSLRKARAILRQVRSMWGQDVIQELTEISHVQNAPYSMRKYIMSEPSLRGMYHRGECEGYGSSYVDQQPGVIGDEHLDYQKVNNGYVHVDEDGSWNATTYSNNYLDDTEEDLTLDQQDDIRSAWDIVKNAIYHNVDPTSKRDADL